MTIELGGWVLNWITMANILYYIVMPLLHFSERKWDWNLSSSHREPSSFRKCVTEKSWTCGWTWPPPGGWVGTSMSCLQALKQKLRSRCILQILQEQNLATEPNKESKWERNSFCLLWWMESMRGDRPNVNSDAGPEEENLSSNLLQNSKRMDSANLLIKWLFFF